jgi:four helix bundle protein
MKQNRFENLEVWQKAHSYTLGVYKLTKSFPKEEKYSLTDQLRRSASSVTTNIVEGNERRSKKEFIQFLYTSKASLAESLYQLLLSKDLNYISDHVYLSLYQQGSEVGKMINGLITYLKKK